MSEHRFRREASLLRIEEQSKRWDVLVIGGGATGVGVALDAASRGLEVLLLEQSDFGKGTSSRSTKLVHGGVRYLQQGNITLVRDALRERTLLRQNAPHLVHDMPFVIPCASLWQRFFYGFGLKIYDFLATGNRFGRSRGVSATKLSQFVPTMKQENLHSGVVYHDGQFDDSRLLINMAQSASQQGACLCNYVAVSELCKDGGKVTGVIAIDQETGNRLPIEATCVVNAAGPFCDAVRTMDDATCEPMIAPSQGVHLVLPQQFFPGPAAMIVPKTSDGRVIFIIPWHGHALVGTTDTEIKTSTLEPEATNAEIEFLLETVGQYLEHPPQRSDILSIFTGIRPLVKGDKSARTASLSRDHVIRFSDSGLVTITGGKWTTVRKMAEDCVDRVVRHFDLIAAKCQTKQLRIHGFVSSPNCDERAHYGSDLNLLQAVETKDPGLGQRLHPDLPIRKSEVAWAVRHEMARTVDDVLARRSRSLFLNAKASLEIALPVAQALADELGHDRSWCEAEVARFQTIAMNFCDTVRPKSS
ncbi:MAG: glycerol-3-phosphate dehydrogenase/oxidase [Rubripirellula sp.]